MKLRPPTDPCSEALSAGDPLRDEPALSGHEARSIRRRVVAEAGAAVARQRSTVARAALAASLVTLLLAWGLWRKPLAIPTHPVAAPTQSPVSPASERRQVQFATPGGTRVVWTLDPDFDV